MYSNFAWIDNYRRVHTLLLDGASKMYDTKEKSNTCSSMGGGFCALVFLNLSAEVYHSPEKVASILAKYNEVESVDIVAGKWELILRVRTKDQNEFYDFLKAIRKKCGIVKASSVITLKQVKLACECRILNSRQ